MTNNQSAKILYDQGFELKEISKIIRVSYNTISKWSSSGNWKQLKTDKLLREETTQDSIRKLIEFQLKVLEKMTTASKKDLDNTDDVVGLSKLLIGKGEIDALQKLFTTIKAKEITWDGIVKSSRELMEYIAEFDLNLAKKVSPVIEDWLNIKRESL